LAAGIRPDPLEELTALPRPLVGFRISIRVEKEGEGREGTGRELGGIREGV
jgi:hypothetical protein